MKPLTHEQDTVLEILVDNTHAFMTPGFVDQVNKAFGTKLTVYRHKADGHRNPKGLTLDNGAQEASGLASFEIAPMLCSALGIDYAESFGRGTQVRNCVEAIRKAAAAEAERSRNADRVDGCDRDDLGESPDY